jgi:hypothetical protein
MDIIEEQEAHWALIERLQQKEQTNCHHKGKNSRVKIKVEEQC